MNIVVYGANSEIVKELTRKYAKDNHFYLISRNEEKLLNLKGDLHARGARDIFYQAIDFSNESLINSFTKITHNFKTIDLLILAQGSLPVQTEIENSIESIDAITSTNFTSYIKVLNLFASIFEKQQSGSIAVFTSVAGDRGRRSNYIYGSLKAAKQTFLQGYSARMSRSGVHVLDIRPGMVETPMTAHLQKGLLFAKADKVASDIKKAIDKKKVVLYTPFFWKYIMLIIKNIPAKIFNKLNF